MARAFDQGVEPGPRNCSLPGWASLSAETSAVAIEGWFQYYIFVASTSWWQSPPSLLASTNHLSPKTAKTLLSVHSIDVHKPPHVSLDRRQTSLLCHELYIHAGTHSSAKSLARGPTQTCTNRCGIGRPRQQGCPRADTLLSSGHRAVVDIRPASPVFDISCAKRRALLYHCNTWRDLTAALEDAPPTPLYVDLIAVTLPQSLRRFGWNPPWRKYWPLATTM